MPKKRKTNKKVDPYYSPEYQVGYKILENPTEFERIGTALQSHNLKQSAQIDFEAQKQRRQNTKEEEWEQKVAEENRQNEELEQALEQRKQSVLGQMADASNVSGGSIQQPTLTKDSIALGQAYGHVKAKDIPGTPEDYGMSDFLKDQWNSFFGEMNHLQAEDARGYQIRMENDKRLIQDFQKSLDNLDEIQAIDVRIDQLRQISRSNLTPGQLTNLENELNQLIVRKQQLAKEYNSLAESRKQLLDLAPKTPFGAKYDEMMSGNQIFGSDSEWNIAGKTTAAHDELNDARRFLYGLGRNGQDPKQMRNQLNLALKEYDKLNEGWNAIIEENEADAKKYKDRVTNWYKGMEQNTEINLFDPYTFLFRMPGIMGGSASSYMKQIPAMAAAIATGTAASLVSGGAAIPILAAGGLTGFGLNRAAGISENNAEVSENARQLIKDRTKLTDEDINDILSGKMVDQAKLRQITENIKSVENLFRQDMAATTWDAAVETMLNTIPIGYISKLGKFARGSKVYQKVIQNEKIKKALESSFGKDFARGYNVGDVAGPLSGVATGVAAGTLGSAARHIGESAALNQLKKKIGNFVISKTDDTLYGSLAHDMWKELSMLGRAATRVEPEVLEGAKKLINGTRVKYITGIGGRLVKAGISEGIEEGKQHLNAEAFKNGQLDERLYNVFDIALTDMLNGITSGAYILGIPLDSLGLIDIKDKDLLQEIKGGMLGGWGQTFMVNTLRETVPYIRSQRANEIILQQIYADKLASQSNFKQYKNWVSKGLFKAGYNDVLGAISRLREINENHKSVNGVYGISPDLIDKAQQDYERVIGIAQSPITRIEAQNAGINVRDWKNPFSWKSNKEYHEFVAAKAIAIDKYNETKANKEAATRARINAELNSDLKYKNDLDNQYASELLETIQSKEDDGWFEHPGETLIEDETGHPIGYGESYSQKLDRLTESQLSEQQNTSDIVKQIAKLAALLKYREQIESGLEAQKNNPKQKIRRGLKQQLENLDKQIQLWTKINEDFIHSVGINIGDGFQLNPNAKQKLSTLEDVENHLVFDQEQHELLRDAYEEELKWSFELDSASISYENLVGKPQRIDENGKARDLTNDDLSWQPLNDLKHFTTTKGNAKKIIDDIHKMEKDDDDFESLIELVYKNELKAQHVADQNGWESPNIDINAPRPVYDGNGNHVRVEFSEDGSRINRKLADNEIVDENGFLYEYPNPSYKDPLKEALKPRKSRTEVDDAIRQSFADTWNKTTGTILPMTPEGFIEMRRIAMVDKTALSSSTPPTPSGKGIKPPIVPPNPPITPIDPVEPEKTPQDEVIEMLEKKYEEDKKSVINDKNYIHTTSQDYFVLVDNKITRMSRVHNIKPESYIHQDRIEEVNATKEQLKNIDWTESQDEIKRQLLSIIPDLFAADNVSKNEKYSDVFSYWYYIKDVFIPEFNNPSSDQINEYDNIIENLAKSIVNSRRDISSSIRMGNIMDEFNRNFYGTQILYSQTSTEDGIIKLYNSKNESDGRTYAELFNNYENFKNLVIQTRNNYEYYTKTLGWKLVSLPFVWRANFDKIGWVAGETDMIGVDKNGGMHIIDFKTSKYTFGKEYVPNIQLTHDYVSDLNAIHAEDFKEGKPNKKVRNILRAIKDDIKNKNIAIVWDDTANRAVIVNKGMPFVSTPNAIYGQVISAFKDYSNQQTAYAQMIQIESGGDVKSIEILPNVCNYDRELRVIYNVSSEPRILLTFSKEMLDILNNTVDKNDETIRSLKQKIYDAYNVLANRRRQLSSKMNDDVFNMLSDNGKLIYSDFISLVNNIQLPADDDIQLLQQLLDEINDILSQYQQTLDALNQDYLTQFAIQNQIDENKQKEDRKKSRVQGEQAGQAVGLVNAENKRSSIGNTEHTNLNWIRVQSDRELELATSSPGFIINADFNLYIENDEVFADISYNGKTWKHVLIDTKYNGSFFPKGQKLIDQISELEKKKNNNQRIVPVRSTMTRTRGRIKLAVDKNNHVTYVPLSSTDLFANDDIYDIEFSAAYGNVGIIDNSDQLVTFDGSDTQRKPIYIWSRLRDVPQRGTLMYLKRVHKDEINRDSIIPVAIDRVKFKDGDISFILSLLQNPEMLDKPYSIQIGGEVHNIYATGRQLINMMIPVVDHQTSLTNITSILRDPANPNIIKLVNRENIATNTTGRGVFDISKQDQLKAFVDELKTMSIAERHDVLLSRLGEDNNNELPFKNLRRFFIENNNSNKSISSIQISETLNFNLDDFKTVTSTKGIKRQGLNGFAYYLKHNMLCTQYGGMGSCNVEINDVILEDNYVPVVQDNGSIIIPNANSDEVQINEDVIDALLLKKSKYGTKHQLNKERALRHLREIIGDKVPVKFENDFLTVANCTPFVIGNCKADCIALSTFAYNGVEYHEAYHRIFEMLLPEKQRDFIYNKIAKRIGVQLYNKDGSENKQAFRECSEYAADRYMDHMNHHMTDIKIPFLTKIYNKIHDWAAMFIHFNDRDLYRTFIEVNKGKYASIKPSKKQIDRFNRIFKELHATIHGVDFDNIVNRAMYDKLRETVLFCIIQGQNVDKSGRNIQEIGKHIDKETFKLGIDKMLSQGYDIIGQKEGVIPTVGQLAMKEIYDNFDNEALRDDIANQISIISTDFNKIREEESIDDAQGDSESVANADIAEHTRASYEFSRFDKTSSRVRFFFATIPDFVYGDPVEVIENNKKIIKKPVKLALNELGLPQFVPVNVVFNEFLNYFHDVDSISELKTGLEYLSKEDPMFRVLYKAIEKMYSKVYTIKDGKIVRNSDQEALLSQLMNIIRSNKHSFDIARSQVTNGQHGLYTITIQPCDMEYNAKFYPTEWNQMLVNGGTPIIKIAEDGSLQFNKNLAGSQFAFQKIGQLFDHQPKLQKAENGAVYNDVGIKQWLSNAFLDQPQNVYLRLKVNGQNAYYNDPKDPGQLEVVKDKIVEALNLLGINFSIDELNYMLRHKYGSTDAEALVKMFNSTSIKDSMSSFILFLNIISDNGIIKDNIRINNKQVSIENAYVEMAFIRDLANWKYQYRHSHDQLTVLATNNKKFYEISDNNYASDVVRFINKRTQEFEDIKSDPYNYFVDEENVLGKKATYGSLILEEITNNPDLYITLRNFIGFKTDKRNDQGSDYFEISKREDYVSKATLLENGNIIFPTLSDKKTWLYIDGIKLPGLNFSNIIDRNGNVIPVNNLGDQFVLFKNDTSQFENMLTQDPEVISRFISYAISEYKSVLKADADLDQMEKDGTKDTEVDNYYTKEQGAKFSSLFGVWEYQYTKGADGNMYISGEKFYSFNDNNKTRKQNIKEAEDRFFNKTREEQEVLIQRLLHKQFLKEIDTCVELGLIEKVQNSDNIFQNYKNVGLNNKAIESIYKALIAKNGNVVDAITEDKYKSLATLIYINDISNKAIMSGQEIERVFSGNPAFYKWKYDKNGNLVDRTVDELKRLGGIISTGNNNFTELKDIPSKYLDADNNFTGNYVCAQVNNELIESPQLDIIEEQMLYGEILTAAYLQRESQEISEFRQRFEEIARKVRLNSIRETQEEISEEDMAFYEENVGKTDLAEQEIRLRISKEIDETSIDVLESQLSDVNRNIAIKKAKEATDSYRLKYKENGQIDDGIDVADGSAYITDTMAEMLLRMNGNYSSAIEKAFKILREETRSTILQKQQAYKDVITSVIGTQKYTAFGRRKHTKTGIQVSYYNKMAVFPLFQCMSTGKMQNIFNKMKLQNIDMLMVDSAVKVGGQYSKQLDWNNFRENDDESNASNHIDNDLNKPMKPSFDEFQFGTYEQKFVYLRKQLNTDPNEDPMMQMKTQMTKIVMTNLFDGRSYYLQDGTVMNGMELRNDIMNIINELSRRGLDSINRRFFKTNSKGEFIDNDGNVTDQQNRIIDEVKFSKEIRKLLQQKDPDKNILSALELVDQIGEDGKVTKHLRLPLNAISNSSWLESILISAINKKVIDVQTSGGSMIQRSVWGMEGSSLFERSKGNILSDENLSPQINGGNRLQMINNEGSMDCVVSVDFIKKMLGGELPRVPIKDKNRNVVWDLVPELDSRGDAKRDKNNKIIYQQKKGKDGKPMFDDNGKPIYKRKIRTREMTFDELRNWLINRKIIGSEANASVIGYRVPTQAESSIHALRIVDILPVVNDTIILPAEFTKITGSDFDIDKLFLSSIQYKVQRKEGEDGKYHQTISDQFKQDSNESYQNRLIRDYIALLLDWRSPSDHRSRTANMLHRSIDNDTKLLTSIIDDIESNLQNSQEQPYGFYSLSNQTESKNYYITGKIGIGPFALNNNNHILTMMYHVRFKHIESSIMAALNLEQLDNRTDQNGQSILSWISGLINAHVDIAKDPFISKLNVGPFTYNIVNLLVRTGLGDKTFYFTSQPIMRELAKAYVNAGSMYMADPYLSKYTLQQQAIDNVADNWFKDSSITFEGYNAEQLIEAIKKGGNVYKDIRTKVNARIKELFDNDLKNDAKNQIDLEHQLFYYLAYLQFDKYANALSNLVTYSKIDTKKHGKSIIEQIIYEKGYNKVYDVYRESNLFEPSGLLRMKNDSYIGVKTENAISSVRDILSGQFIQSTPAFLGSVDRILNSIGRTESLSAPLVTKVANALSAAIKSQFFNDEYVPSISNNPNFMHDLVSESQEMLDFVANEEGNVIKVTGNMYHDLISYNNGGIQLQIVMKDGSVGVYNSQIRSINPIDNTITLSHRLPKSYGKVVLKNGKNTIYDRLSKLKVAISSDPAYHNLKDGSGEINNRVLQMLVPGNTSEYQTAFVNGERPDTYETMKFIKFFNFVEDSGSTSNYIIDAWDELLHFTDENKDVEKTVRDFARDLIVYGFITSGDRGGFTKIFKYVPVSWREESGYGDYIQSKLLEYSIGNETDIDTDDIILNNWFDNDFIRTYKLQDKDKKAQFIQYKTKLNGVPTQFATVLAAIKVDNGVYVPSIDPEEAPLFIKIARRRDYNSYNSQRRFTVYKLHKIAIGKNNVKYPVYIKVNPKGNQITGGFLITEYGRDDSVWGSQEYQINEDVLEQTYKAAEVGNYVQSLSKTEPIFASIIDGLSRAYNKEQESSVTNLTGLNRTSIQQQNIEQKDNNFDDSEFSDEAMNHCKT